MAARLAPLRVAEEAAEGLQALDQDFAAVDSVGPVRVAEFLYGARNDIAEADAWGAVRDVLDALDTE